MTPWKIVETAEGGDMNEELRRRIEARRDEELATIASVAAGAFGSSAAKRQYRAKHKATADALEWVLDLLDAQPAAVSLPAIDVDHLTRQALFSAATFGPGRRTAGVCDHIRKELTEIEADPDDLAEWVDVVILALDGAWRTGATPAEIIAAVKAKQAKNEAREWPDWRTAPPDQAIEHVRAAVSLELPEPPPFFDMAFPKPAPSTEPPIEDAGSGGVK